MRWSVCGGEVARFDGNEVVCLARVRTRTAKRAQ
jgi:hypothetical protein